LIRKRLRRLPARHSSSACCSGSRSCSASYRSTAYHSAVRYISDRLFAACPKRASICSRRRSGGSIFSRATLYCHPHVPGLSPHRLKSRRRRCARRVLTNRHPGNGPGCWLRPPPELTYIRQMRPVMSNLLWQTFVRGAYKAVGLDSPYSQQEYGANWSKQRRRCLDRDDHACRVCGSSQSDIGRQPAVHHITPRSEFGDSEWQTYNALDNLVTLCPSCHGTYEGRFIDCDVMEFLERVEEANA